MTGKLGQSARTACEKTWAVTGRCAAERAGGADFRITEESSDLTPIRDRPAYFFAADPSVAFWAFTEPSCSRADRSVDSVDAFTHAGSWSYLSVLAFSCRLRSGSHNFMGCSPKYEPRPHHQPNLGHWQVLHQGLWPL